MRNIDTVLSDPSRLIYAVAAKSVSDIYAVRDGGIALIVDDDDATGAELRAVAVAPGHARTCIAEGLIRLGAAPVFPVTVDGDAKGATVRLLAPNEIAGAARMDHSRRRFA